tara:strand:- start:217 stop:822 length:606 start_codon:yes stop_codon:yes gene_type:complete
MKKVIFILVFIPFIACSQTFISTNFIERTNSGEKITPISMFNNLSVGSFINDNLILGITTEDAVLDYIEEGYNPVQDSLIISNFQLFLKYYTDDFFLLMKMPPYTNFSNISINDNIRVGVGYVIYRDENLDFEVSYNRLLNSNQNGFHKGELNVGISTSISSLTANRKYRNLQGYSSSPNFFRSVLDWINTPLAHGYRESL